MKNVKKYAAVLALIFAFPGTGSAKEINAWRDCGIGAMIFSDYPVAAVVSNVIWDLGTTALTSAGASEETCKGKEVATAQYIFETYSNLEIETAKGEGKHVTAMLGMMGCDNASHSSIISSIRNDFSKAINNPSYANKTTLDKAEAYHSLVHNRISANFGAQCQVI